MNLKLEKLLTAGFAAALGASLVAAAPANAGDVHHIGLGIVVGKNDGKLTRVLTDGKTKMKMRAPLAAFPVANKGQGELGARQMSQEERGLIANILYDIDPLLKPIPARGNQLSDSANVGTFYNHYMY